MLGVSTPEAPENAQKMPLTDTAIKKLKPTSKPAKVADERGLYLLIQPTGSKLWRWKYRFDGREKMLDHFRFKYLHLW